VYELSLEGQTAIVTGGSKGIGRAIALAFVQAGASVAIAARGQDDLDRTAKEIGVAGGRAIGVQTDVTDLGQVQDLIRRATEEFGTVDILVNNAGAAPFIAPLADTRLEGFERYFRVNFNGAVYCTKAVAPVLLQKGRGCVLNVASVAGLLATPGESYYGSAKAALIQFTRTVAREWATSGVRVNALAPGWTETPLNEPLRVDPEANRAILASIPLGRWGTPEEIAAAALFLCSPAASFITGTVLIVDGGQTTTSLSGL
jgi:NAD(P)-dependent dehydrogenase (short-subunit alcohol dehydrogenase family)